MNQPGNDREDQRIFLWFACLIIVFCIVPLLYAAHPDAVNTPLLRLAKAQLKAFTPFFEEAENAFARIAAADPASLSWDTMQKVLRYRFMDSLALCAAAHPVRRGRHLHGPCGRACPAFQHGKPAEKQCGVLSLSAARGGTRQVSALAGLLRCRAVESRPNAGAVCVGEWSVA